MVTKKQLEDLGLSNKEASVYLALLELGPSTMTEIARVAKINRTTGYPILESLATKGLIYFIGDSKIQKFATESPERVVLFLENKIREDQEKIKRVQSFLPELLSVYNVKEKPRVKFYEGIDKMKEAFEDTLTANGEILAYAVGTEMFETISRDYFEDYSKRKVAKNIKVRVIAPDDEASRAIVAKDREELRESRLVPKDMFYFSVETNIYNNKVLTISWKEKFAVITESAEIASAQKKIFELSWIGAKTIEKK